ncbi:MAG: tetratricopeptide repeat protein [Planctomycetes bacterium]|nr:tetratricopeptide repeat protein [Planctomycetota bacterium]
MAPSDVTAESFSSRKVCLARAREHLANRSYKAARNTLTRGQRQWADLEFDHEALTLMGNIAFRQGRYREARGLLNRATRDADCHVEARFMLGRTLLESGRVEHAIRILDRILHDESELVPYRVHAGGALSVAYSALGLNKSSQDALEEAAHFGLISAQLLADEGFRLMRVGAYPEAEVQLAKGLQVDSTCEDAFFRLCNTLYIQGKTEPAMEVLAYGIEQSPEFVPFYTLMSELYSGRGQYKEAGAFLKRALEIVPDADDADQSRFMMAQALQRAGRTEAAIMGFKEVLQKHPRTRLKRDVQQRLKALQRRDKDARIERLINFPRKLQKRAYCAPNTLANVLTFVGAPVSQEDVAARVFRGTSTHWPEVFDYFKGVEKISWRGFFGTLDLLRRCIDVGIPVITTEYYGMSGHAIAVIGYNDQGGLVIAQDPRFLEPVEIPYSQFENAWQHDDALCIAVAPESERRRLPGISGDDERLVREFVDLLRKRNEGADETAMRAAAELSSTAPEKQAPLRILAEMALERRAFSELRQLCEEALRKWSDCFWAVRHLGDALWMDGDTAGALARYRQARRLDRRDETLSYAIGELLLSTGERKRGRGYLLRALHENVRFHRARLRLAQDLLETGDTDDARFHARLLIEYDPDHTAARELMASITGNTAVISHAEGARKANKEADRVREAADATDPDGGDDEAGEETGEEEVEIDLEDL